MVQVSRLDNTTISILISLFWYLFCVYIRKLLSLGIQTEVFRVKKPSDALTTLK